MYDFLARFYDVFNYDVDYENLADKLAVEVGGEGIDFGCGTCKLAVALSKRNMKITAVDVSSEMLSMATERVRGNAVTTVLGDIRTFKPMKKADFALAICDTLNYVSNPKVAIRNVYNCLRDGGTFIFDVSTEYKLRQLAGKTFSDTVEGVTYVWQNSSVMRNSLQMHLTFFVSDGQKYDKFEETQTQYIHKTYDLLNALNEVGFKANAYADLTKTRCKEHDLRTYFIAKKEK